MARDSDILDQDTLDPEDWAVATKRSTMLKKRDSHLHGIKCLLAEVSTKATKLGRFLMHLPMYNNQENVPGSNEDEEMRNIEDTDNNQESSPSIAKDESDLPPIDVLSAE
ncbi:hypothetical protein MJO29_011122 [Puccinia striiformis f. sp. tritici]|nr:hypothetical protein MJO29_011122 [Puccinia striiformis f. sp. tritici]